MHSREQHGDTRSQGEYKHRLNREARFLDISENPLRDISALSTCAQLRGLRLNFTFVKDISALSRLTALEESVGARLFDRTPSGYVPTSAGEELLEVARSIQSQIVALDTQVLGSDARLSGSLRVNTLDVVATFFAPAIW